eukprot:875330-Rhodomonas_salina.2
MVLDDIVSRTPGVSFDAIAVYHPRLSSSPIILCKTYCILLCFDATTLSSYLIILCNNYRMMLYLSSYPIILLYPSQSLTQSKLLNSALNPAKQPEFEEICRYFCPEFERVLWPCVCVCAETCTFGRAGGGQARAAGSTCPNVLRAA